MTTINISAPSFVKETTTTTGTGDYTLAGAVTGFGSFNSYVANGYTIYTCTDGGSNFENGIGYASGTNLQRIKVLRSSNANAAVNWAAGTKYVFTADVGSLGIQTMRLNTAAGMPTTASDIDAGYTPFSLWRDTTYAAMGLYLCLNPDSSAAKWGRISLIDSSNTLSSGSEAVVSGKNNTVSFPNCVVSGTYSKTTRRSSTVIGSNSTGLNAAGAMQAEMGALGTITTDATPTVLQPDTSVSDDLAMASNSAIYLDINVIGYSNASTLVSAWHITGLFRKTTGAPAAVGTPAVTMMYQDGGASAWAVAIAGSGTNNAVQITVTGAASTTIRWTAEVRIAHAGF